MKAKGPGFCAQASAHHWHRHQPRGGMVLSGRVPSAKGSSPVRDEPVSHQQLIYQGTGVGKLNPKLVDLYGAPQCVYYNSGTFTLEPRMKSHMVGAGTQSTKSTEKTQGGAPRTHSFRGTQVSSICLQTNRDKFSDVNGFLPK